MKPLISSCFGLKNFKLKSSYCISWNYWPNVKLWILLVNIILFMLGLTTTHIMLFWFKAQVQILYLVAFHNCNCMTWVSNGIDFDAWFLSLLMINDFMKYFNSMDFHFACGQGNGNYWCQYTRKQPRSSNPYSPSLHCQ